MSIERLKDKSRGECRSMTSSRCVVKKCKKELDIQQLKFAGGHPPNYYAAGRMLKYARADGMACSHSPVVVCAQWLFG